MISDLRIHQRGDHLLVEVPASLTGRLLSAFDALIFSEDVVVSDVSASVSQIAVIGTGAADAVARALTIDAGRLNGLAPLAGIGGGTTFVARADDSEAWPVFDVFVSRDEAASVESALELAGAPQISPEVLEAARIEAGRPAFGVDMTDETIPLEAGLLDRGISTTKGCYVGQEIIIRVLHRGGGRVAKRLSRLELDASATEAPVAGADPLGRRQGNREDHQRRLLSSARSHRRARIRASGFCGNRTVSRRRDAPRQRRRVHPRAGRLSRGCGDWSQPSAGFFPSLRVCTQRNRRRRRRAFPRCGTRGARDVMEATAPAASPTGPPRSSPWTSPTAGSRPPSLTWIGSSRFAGRTGRRVVIDDARVR